MSKNIAIAALAAGVGFLAFSAITHKPTPKATVTVSSTDEVEVTSYELDFNSDYASLFTPPGLENSHMTCLKYSTSIQCWTKRKLPSNMKATFK